MSSVTLSLSFLMVGRDFGTWLEGLGKSHGILKVPIPAFIIITTIK